MSQLFTSGGQRIGVSASASVLPMNIQDSSPLGWTGWISLQSKGLSRVFSNTTVEKHQFFGSQLYSPILTSIRDYWKNHSFDRWTFGGKVMSLLHSPQHKRAHRRGSCGQGRWVKPSSVNCPSQGCLQRVLSRSSAANTRMGILTTSQVTVNLLCQLGWPTVSGYLAKHHFRGDCEDIFQTWSTF